MDKDNLFKIKDMIGFNNEYLTVISFNEIKRNNLGKTRAFWNCLCKCGNYTIKNTYQLTSGIPKSCGCYNQIRKGNTSNHKYMIKHGLANKHNLYKVWKNIKTRCYNKNNKGYKYWGAKGIIICDEWKNDALKFISWCLDNGWKDNLVIDRINNKGNYEPNNCQFITKSENAKKIFIDNLGLHKGSNNKSAIINEKIVSEIKKLLFLKVSKKDIQKKFNISKNIMYQISHNKTWKHVKTSLESM